MSDSGDLLQWGNNNVLKTRGFILSSTVILFILSTPLLIFVFVKIFGIDVDNCGEENSQYCNKIYIGINWLAIFSCAALFGAIGVMISIIVRRDIDEKFQNIHIFPLVLILYIVGSIFAIIMLSLFVGGFLQGSLFPKFEDGSWLSLNFRSGDWGQLVIWSFVAGFSERLMPGMVDRIASQMEKSNTVKIEPNAVKISSPDQQGQI